MTTPEADVVILNRWRAVVARARNPRKRLEIVLNDPGAAMLVPQIPAEEFYYLVRAVGVSDVGELLELASADQVRTCLDMDGWDGDQLSLERLTPWLEALEELSPRRLAAVVRELDIEWLSSVFAATASIYERATEESPEPMRKHPTFESPDGYFVVEFTGADRELGRVLERFLAALYTVDPDLGRMLLLEAQVGLPAELEETSLRWRTARMAELGFIDYYEALEVYRPLDPATLRSEHDTPVPARRADIIGLPAVFADSLAGDTFLGRVLAEIEEAGPLNAVTGRLVAALNRVLVADRINPADLDAIASVTARARDTLSLALEVLADGDVAHGRRAIERLGMVELFRAGVFLTMEPQRRAQQLRTVGVDDPDLLPLLERRPEFPCALDDAPRAGQRPFRTREDLRRVGARLDVLEAEARRTGAIG